MDNLSMLFVLLVVYQLKHFVADYPLQTKWMLGKFKAGWDFVGPLTAHCGVHAALTALICAVLAPHLIWLAAIDFAVHFAMDRVKASPKLLGRFKAMSANEFGEMAIETKLINETVSQYKQSGQDTLYISSSLSKLKEYENKVKHNTYFWWALGFDQMVHHLTDLFIVYMIFTN